MLWEVWRRVPESNRRRRICNPLHSHFANPPWHRQSTNELYGLNDSGKVFTFPDVFGAGKESRTLDLNLGKVALYQLSYSRIAAHYSRKIAIVKDSAHQNTIGQ